MSIFLRHRNPDLKNLSRPPGIPFRLPIVLKKASPSCEETKIPRLEKCLSAPKVGFWHQFLAFIFWLIFLPNQDSKKLSHGTRFSFCLRVLCGHNGSHLEGNRNRTTEKSDAGQKLIKIAGKSLDWQRLRYLLHFYSTHLLM